MELVLRAAAIYVLLVFVFRIAGKRSLAEATTFDLVLLLIISEATQQALLGEDFSITAALVVIVTLVLLEIGTTHLQYRLPRLNRVFDSTPLVIVEDGRPIQDRLDKARIDVSEILQAARTLQGLERLEQVKYAVLERSGAISIVPKR